MKLPRQLLDGCFYDNYQRVWLGANPSEMIPIYIREMDTLIRCIEKGDTYCQEFAKDYPLADRLKMVVDGRYEKVSHQKSQWEIQFYEKQVVFKNKGQTIYSCSYGDFYQIMTAYLERLGELVPKDWLDDWMTGWTHSLEEARKAWNKAPLVRLSKTMNRMRFWRRPTPNGESHYEGEKSLHLKGTDLASFKQLSCQDTLRALTMEGLPLPKDQEVLAQYTHLTSLYLRDMGLRDLGFVSGLTGLEEMGLRGNRISDLSPIASLENLESLYIAGNPVKDFSVLERLPNLKTLYADDKQLPDQAAWDRIPEWISLKVLHLTKVGDPLEYQYNVECIYQRTPPAPEPLPEAPLSPAPPPVEEKKDPRRLYIRDRWLYSGICNALGYLPAVKYDLTKLRELDCSNYIALCEDYLFLTETGDFSCLEAAVKLRKLNLSGRVVNDFSWLRSCVNLTHLDLSNTNFEDIDLLMELHKLKDLNLWGCPALRGTDKAVEWLRTLRNVQLPPQWENKLYPLSARKRGGKF